MSESTSTALSSQFDGMFQVGSNSVFVALWSCSEQSVNTALQVTNDLNLFTSHDCTFRPAPKIFLARTALLPSALATSPIILAEDAKHKVSTNLFHKKIESKSTKSKQGDLKKPDQVLEQSQERSPRVLYISTSSSHLGLHLRTTEYYFLPIPSYKLQKHLSLTSKQKICYTILHLPSLSNQTVSNVLIQAPDEKDKTGKTQIAFSSHFDDLEMSTTIDKFQLQLHTFAKIMTNHISDQLNISMATSGSFPIYLPSISDGPSYAMVKVPSSLLLSSVHGVGGGTLEEMWTHTPLEFWTRNERYHARSQSVILISRSGDNVVKNETKLQPTFTFGSPPVSLIDRILSSPFLQDWVTVTPKLLQHQSIQIPFSDFITFHQKPKHQPSPSLPKPLPLSASLQFREMEKSLSELCVTYDCQSVLHIFSLFLSSFSSNIRNLASEWQTTSKMMIQSIQAFLHGIGEHSSSLMSWTLTKHTGCLIHGLQNCGKKSIIRSMSTILGIPVVPLNLLQIIDREHRLDPALHSPNAPRPILFADALSTRARSSLSPSDVVSPLSFTPDRYSSTLSLLIEALRGAFTPSTHSVFENVVVILVENIHEMFPHDTIFTEDDNDVAKAVSDVLSGMYNSVILGPGPCSQGRNPKILFLGVTDNLQKVSKEVRSLHLSTLRIFDSQIEVSNPSKSHLKYSICQSLLYGKDVHSKSTREPLLERPRDHFLSPSLFSQCMALSEKMRLEIESKTPNCSLISQTRSPSTAKASSTQPQPHAAPLETLLDYLLQNTQATYELPSGFLRHASYLYQQILFFSSSKFKNFPQDSLISLTEKSLFRVVQKILHQKGSSTAGIESPVIFSSTEFQEACQEVHILSKSVDVLLKTDSTTPQDFVLSDFFPKKTFFRHLVGLSDSKSRLREAATYFLSPSFHIESMNSGTSLMTSSGILLYGPTGCGKTALARSLFNETRLPVFELALSELLHSGVGESEKFIRKIFSQAISAAPSILFIDDIHALFPNTMLLDSLDPDAGASPTILAEFINHLDILKENGKILLVSTAPHPSIVHPALVVSGRIDNHVKVSKPNKTEREAFFWRFFQRQGLILSITPEMLVQRAILYASQNFQGYKSLPISSPSPQDIDVMKYIVKKTITHVFDKTYKLGGTFYQLKEDVSSCIDVTMLVKLTKGFSFAQMQQLLSECARRAQFQSIVGLVHSSQVEGSPLMSLSMGDLVKSIKGIALSQTSN